MSIIIVKNERGYIASLRFDDETLNEEISANNWHTIHAKVENVMMRKGYN